MSVRTDADLFRRLPLFAECDDAQLQLLAFSSERISCNPGDTLAKASETGNTAWLVVTGTADVWIKEGDARKTVATLAHGMLAGELAMIAGQPYRANITATSALTAIRVSRDVFMRVAGEFPEFAVRVQRSLARRLDASLADINRARKLFDEARSFSKRQV